MVQELNLEIKVCKTEDSDLNFDNLSKIFEQTRLEFDQKLEEDRLWVEELERERKQRDEEH